MTRLNRCFIFVVLTLSGVALPVMARHPGEYLTKIRPERFHTSCHPFAADFAKGPLKVLFFTPARVAPREVVELKQRFNMEIDATLYESPPNDKSKLADDTDVYNGAMAGTSTTEKLEVLDHQLDKRWDAFVFGANVIFDGLPPKAQYKLLKQVFDGAGLVVFSSLRKELTTQPTRESSAQILSGVPFPLLASYSLLTKTPLEKLPDDLLKTYTFGKGRIALLKHYAIDWPNNPEGYWQGFHTLTPAIPYSYKEKVYYDYYLSVVAKTLLWTVPGKASDVVPSSGNAVTTAVSWNDLPRIVSCGSFTIPADLKLTCKIELRDLFGKVINLPTQPVQTGSFELKIKLPELPQGDYFADYRFLSRHGTEYWGSYGFSVRDPSVTLQDIKCSKSRYLLSDVFHAEVRLSQTPQKTMSLKVTGVDLDEREIFHQEISVTQQVVIIEAELSRCVMMPHHLRVELWDGQRLLDLGRRDFLVARKDPFYPNIVWGDCLATLLGEIQTEQLRKAGFNVSLAHDPQNSARRDMLEMDYLIALRFPTPSDKEPECGFNNTKWVADYVAKNITEPVEKKKDFGVYYYSLGDENSYSYAREKVAPSELRAYQQYLQEVYAGDLRLLNREWGSNYQQFDGIPITDVQQSLGMSDIPRKNQWMNFCEKQYSDAHHQMALAIKKVDPTARVGAEGSLPGDLESMLDGLEMWGPYPSRLDNVLMRSFGNPSLLKGNWWGGYAATRPAKAQPYWDQVLSGGVNSNFYFAIDGCLGCLSGDMSYADYFEKDQLPVMREITEKIGPLINKTPIALMGVGIFYNLPSEHAVTLDTRFGTVGSCRDGLLKFCEESGISSFFYSERQILAGKLTKDGVRLLFMPQSLCVSDGVATVLRQWVEQGGVLVTDQQAGIRNERAALREKGVLDDLLGVRQSITGEPQIVKVVGNLFKVQVEWERIIVDSGVTTTTGSAALLLDNKIPVIITNLIGRGRSVMLNMSLGKILANYSGVPGTRRFLLYLMEQAGIFTGLKSPPGYLVTRFQGEGYELLSCRISAEGKNGEKLYLGKKYHVYDVRRGMYLGLIGELTPSACSGQNNLFALMTAPVSDFEVDYSSSLKAGDLSKVIITSHLTSGHSHPDRLYRIRVFDPKGSELVCFRQFVKGYDTPVLADLPLALNQQPGKYRLEVTDILTGQVKIKAFVLQGGK